MADPASKYTDDQIDEVERQIKAVYSSAYIDILHKQKEFNAKHQKKADKYLKKVADGEMTQEQYERWLKGQVFQGEQWEAKRKQILDVIYNSNRTATDILNGKTHGVFAHNATYANYEMEHNTGINFGFGIYDTATVSNLIKNDPKLLPEWKIDQPKDYVWNQRKLNKQITLGIIEGESLDKIASRLSDSLCTQNFNKMRTFARTAMTGAQNSGRLFSYENAKGLGIKVKKQWMATLDHHTRITHQELDGQIRDTDKPFEVGGLKIRYPGDPFAAAALVFNCRCTLVSEIEDYPSTYERYDNIEGKPIPQMTYNEWRAMNEALAEKAEASVMMLDESQAKGLISIFAGKKMSNVYNEMRELDSKTATAFYNELKSMGKPSEIWQQYLDGTLPSNIDTSRLNGILQAYAEKKGLVKPNIIKPEITNIKDQLQGIGLGTVHAKLGAGSSAYNELYSALTSIRNNGEFAPQVWNRYLAGKLDPEDAKNIENILRKYADKLGINIVTPSTGTNIKEIFGGKKMSNVYNEMKTFDKTMANQFYKQLGSMGKPSDIWQQYLDGKLSSDQMSVIEKMLSEYANKAGLIKPVAPVGIDIKGLVGDKKMSNFYNELKGKDTKIANEFYKELKSLGKPSEVWEKYVNGQIKNSKLDEILKNYFGVDSKKVTPIVEKIKDWNDPSKVKGRVIKAFGGTGSSNDIMGALSHDEFDKLYKLLKSIDNESIAADTLNKYVNGKLSPSDTEKINDFLKHYFNAPKKKTFIPDINWVAESISSDKFKKSAKNANKARNDTITAVMKTPENYRKCFINALKNVRFFDDNQKAYYQDGSRSISINFDKILKRDRSLGTLFHENGHAMDYMIMRLRNPKKKEYQFKAKDRTSQLPKFLSAIDKDLKYIADNIDNPESSLSVYSSDIWNNGSKGVQDFISALKPLNDQGPRKGKIPNKLLKLRYHWGHSYDYYMRYDDPMIDAASELFANISGGYADAEQMKYMKRYFPNSVKAFEEIIDETAKLIKK